MNRTGIDQQALEIARPLLESLCAASGCSVPDLEIVESLPGGNIATARASKVHGNGTIQIPASLVIALSHSALTFLLGHELGHIALKRSSSVVLRRLFWGLFGILMVFFVACVFKGATGGGPEYFLMGVGSVFMTIPVVAAVTALIRRHEAGCDLFSVRLVGDISGALEYLGQFAAAAESKKPKGRWERMFDHHPSNVRRMELLRRHFPG